MDRSFTAHPTEITEKRKRKGKGKENYGRNGKHGKY
jgi:hypothetical protein